MDLEEAKKVVEINEVEKASLDKYQGPFHVAINTLIDLTPSGYEKIAKSWKLPDTKEEFESVMDDFINVNSAIYKYSKAHSNEMVMETLYRGTGNKDVARLKKDKKSLQFISTTTSKQEAKSIHPVYGDAALVTIHIGDDVPRINTKEFLNGKKDENEILISPFALIKDKKEVSRYDGYTYYDVEIENVKKEEKDIDVQELKNRREKVVEGFSDYRKNMKDAISIDNKIEQLLHLLSRQGCSIEDRKYISKDLEEAREKQSEIYDNLRDYKENLRYVIEDECYVKEKEIDEADKLVKENLMVIAEENKRKESLQEYNDLISNTKDRALDFDDILGKEYDSILSNDAALKEKRILLGLEGKDELPADVGAQIADIFCSIDEINKKADELYIDVENPENTVEMINARKSRLAVQNTLYDKMDINDFVRVSHRYKDARTKEFKKDIFVKANEYIKKAKIEQLTHQIEIKQGEKVGFFDKLFGKEKLKKVELENLMLKKQVLESEKLDTDSLKNYDIKDTLVELYKAMNVDVSKNYTKDIGVFYQKIIKEYYPNNAYVEAEIHQKVVEEALKNNNSLDLSTNVKKESTKEKIDRIKEENDELHTSIVSQNNSPTRIRVFDSSSSKACKRQMKLIVEGYNKLLKKSILINEKAQTREEQLNEAMNVLRKPNDDELLNEEREDKKNKDIEER